MTETSRLTPKDTPRIYIDENHFIHGIVPCSICSRRFKPTGTLDFFISRTKIVCDPCGKRCNPELYDLLESKYGREQWWNCYGWHGR